MPPLIVSIARLAAQSGRLAVLRAAPALLAPQKKDQCYADHAAVVKHVYGQGAPRAVRLRPSGFLSSLNMGSPSSAELLKLLETRPVLVSGYRLAHEKSKYTTHHYVALIDVVEYDGKPHIVAVDRDDTVERSQDSVYLWEPDELAARVSPVIADDDGDSAAAVEVPERTDGVCTIL